MARRVSVKGKGADLFFGEYDAETTVPTTVPTDDEEPAPPPAAAHNMPPAPVADEHTRRPVKQARMQASKHASKQECTDGQLAVVLADVWESVASAAGTTNSFRYTDHELAWLTDVLYAVSKRHGVRLTKQDVARLGLNVVLRDYEARGDASLLAAFAERKKQR